MQRQGVNRFSGFSRSRGNR